MNFRAFILLITLILPSVFYAAVPPYIKGDTIENICKKVICDKEILKAYKSYYPRQFHKAFAISSYKSGNKYYIDYAGWSSKKQMRIRAEMAALTACGKHAKHYCKVLFLNNAIYDEDFYVLLTQTTTSKSSSSSSNSSSGSSSSASKKITIPANAYATGFDNQGWKCNSGYTQSGNNCIKTKTSTNTYSSMTNDEYFSSTLKGEGFLGKILNKVGLIKKKIYIPANAYAYGSSWKCNYGYKRSGNSCIKKITIPANAYAYGTSWKCFEGFKKVGTRCEKLTWKDGEYWDQEVRPGVNRMMALGILLSEMGSNNRRNTNFNNTLINSSPKLNSTSTFGYRYGEWLYDSNNNFMGYIKNGITYDRSMRKTGTIRNNNIYNNTGNYVGPLGQDYKPGNVDFFD